MSFTKRRTAAGATEFEGRVAIGGLNRVYGPCTVHPPNLLLGFFGLFAGSLPCILLLLFYPPSLSTTSQATTSPLALYPVYYVNVILESILSHLPGAWSEERTVNTPRTKGAQHALRTSDDNAEGWRRDAHGRECECVRR